MSSNSPFEMRFDPRTIQHLGVRMYSTLPPAIAEIVANAYDADASRVEIQLEQDGDNPSSIVVSDDGHGLAHDEINEKFLVIGRNRRDDGDGDPTPRFGRLPIGKKGLGKLALFGLATTIKVDTRKDGLQNVLSLNWVDLIDSKNTYKPKPEVVDGSCTEPSGTRVTLSGLKRKSPFDAEALANSLSRIFIVDDDFHISLRSPSGERLNVDRQRRYGTLDIEFEWDFSEDHELGMDQRLTDGLSGKLMTAKTPIPPSSGLRGVTLFSRKKLVNAPEYFTSSTSSHFYQYLTGHISVDFIDELDEDVIATNRQSLNWEHPRMVELREQLSSLVTKVAGEWRQRRKEKKTTDFKEKTGIDANAWLDTMSGEVRTNTETIITSLGGEDALEHFGTVVEALHALVPEYPMLHWRHLHLKVRDRVRSYYEKKQYGHAASEGVKIFAEILRHMTGLTSDAYELVNDVFGIPSVGSPKIQLNAMSTESERNIQDGQGHLSRGVMRGFRNPILHEPMDSAVPALFSEVDCLNILSLVSYLVTRLDSATVNPSVDATS